MAKKRRKDEVEEPKYEFVPPDFDEKTFLEKDVEGTKTLMITALVAIVFGVLAFLLTDISAIIGGVLIVVGAVALRYIFPLFKVNKNRVENKTMIGNYALMFLLALGIWIMLLNPPFSDHSAPDITAQKITFDDGTGWQDYTSSTPIHSGDSVKISVNVSENGRIASVQIDVYPSSSQSGTYVDMVQGSAYGRYSYTNTYVAVGGSSTQYLYNVKVIDGAGFQTVKSGAFTVNP